MNKATWKNNAVTFVQWNGDNLTEVQDFVGKEHKIYKPIDNGNELYIKGIGIIGNGDYICKNQNYAYNTFDIYSWKTFPRLINEDIGSGLD